MSGFSGSTIGDLLLYIASVINKAVIPLIFTLALTMFVWGVAQFIMGSGEEEKRTKGKQFMLWGIIGLAVMFGVLTIVTIFGATFGLNGKVLPQVNPPIDYTPTGS